MAITNTDFQAIAIAISAYSDEAYTGARRINSTGIVGSDVNITSDGESFIGQFRWYNTITPVVNVPSLSDATAGDYTSISTSLANYVKAFRAQGAKQVNLQQVITKEDGLKKFTRDFTELRAEDEHNAVLSVLKGVAASEASVGGGIVDFDTVPSGSVGMFVDLNANGKFGAAATSANDERRLFDATALGAARGERLFISTGMGFKDHEPDFLYMITSPETMADLRAANLVDEDRVKDGNLEFQTIFGGKYRLILTRAAQGNLAASANVNDRSVKTTFLVKPGSIVFQNIAAPVPVEVDRAAATYLGGGSTEVWYRYGFIVHPKGYDWAGSTSAFATNAAFASAASWDRVFDPLNLGILPIFHA